MAQETTGDWDEFAAQYTEEFQSADAANASSVEEQLNQLYVLHLAPVNLNTADREDLAQLPFLSEAAVDSLLAFRDRHGRYYSLGDLQFVNGIDFRTRQWLPLFVQCGSAGTSRPGWRELLGGGQWEVSGQLGVPLYRRAGNRSHSEEELAQYPNRQYLGNGLSHTLRVNYESAGLFSYAIKLDKDAGEPFAAYGNRPYDEWAFHVAYRPRGNWQRVVVGDFRVNAGDGLILGNSFITDKAGIVDTYRPPTARISPTLSSSGSNLFRGLAATWERSGWAWTLFASYRKLDANLNDSGQVTSLKTDGYHRTPLERSKRRNLGATAGGAVVEYGATDWRVGTAVTAVYYDRAFSPREALYNRYYLRGHWAGGLSAYYGVRWGRLTSRGEAAVDRKGHIALSNRMTYRILPDWNVALLLRKLTVRFVTPAGQTLQEGSRVANEEGVLVASQFRIGGVEGRVYADFFRFPWATYRASQPSKGMELSGEFSYRQGRQQTWKLRYRMKAKQRNVTGYDGLMEYVTTHRLRLTVEHSGGRITWTAAADGVAELRQTRGADWGAMGSGRVTWRTDRWRLAALGAVFFTDSYATGLTVYQPGFANTYGFLRCYYHGAATALLADWEMFRGLRIGMRYSLMAYFNRDTIASGTQQIDAPTKNDLLFRLSWKF